MVLEAEANGGIRQVVSPTFPFPLPLSIPPKFSDKPVRGKFPGFPLQNTNTTL